MTIGTVLKDYDGQFYIVILTAGDDILLFGNNYSSFNGKFEPLAIWYFDTSFMEVHLD